MDVRFLPGGGGCGKEKGGGGGGCPHPSRVVSDGEEVCVTCGCVVEDIDFSPDWRYYDSRSGVSTARCHQSRSTAKTIDNIVEGLCLPAAVKAATEQKYRHIVGDQTFRGNTRKAIVAACLMFVYREMDDIRTQRDIQRLFDLSQKDMSTGLKQYYVVFPEARTQEVTAVQLLKRILLDTGLPLRDHLRRVQTIARLTERTSATLERSSPQNVAAAIVYQYLRMYPAVARQYGLDTPTAFATAVDLSDITVIRLAAEVETVLKRARQRLRAQKAHCAAEGASSQ